MTDVRTVDRRPTTTRPKRVPSAPNKVRKHLPLYFAISPFYVIFGVFGIFPIAFSLFLSFQRWNGIGSMSFAGLDQYAYLVQDPDFWWSVVNTFEIWVMATVPMLFLALVIAVLLNSQIRFKTAYRIAFFIPNITSIVALTVIFGSIFANNFGLLNGMLEALGVDRVEWLNQPWGIKFAIAVMVIWRWTGYNAIIFLAGLQAIPPDIFEAAKIDGAGAVQTFFRVTIPSLRPVILFAVIMSTVGGLQIFTEPQVLFGDSTGGTGGAGQTIVLYLYDQAFTRSDFGYAAAIGWALFLILILFSIINWRLVQRPGDR